MPTVTPKVSILIPNFNNGRSSSNDGKRDFLGDLLCSLQDTLGDDPTPFEVIVYDDGSTDESLATARLWAQKKWPDGRAFLELIEAAHCGYLSRTANVLCRRARGEILVRLDGDIVCLTPRWVQAMCRVFDLGPPRLGIVGPKQLGSNMRIHAMGDWLLHPNGYIHVAMGMERRSVRWPIEVDHVMGCFHCMKRVVYDEVGGYDENFLRGQTEDLGLRARLKGWTVWAVPHIEFVHYHHQRKNRATAADSHDGIVAGLKTFEDKWGFSRMAPDLDEVRRRYAGTPLLWNARWFGSPGMTPGDVEFGDPAETAPEPLRIETSDWGRFANDAATRGPIEFRVNVAREVIRQAGIPRQAVHIACGTGLIAHLLAMQGVPVLGVDRRANHLDLARAVTGSRDYPKAAPRFIHQTHPRTLPLPDASVDLLLIFDELERHPNPVALLREARRVLIPGKPLAIVSQRRWLGEDSPADSEHRYFWHELINQIRAVGLSPMIDTKGDDPARDMILIVTVRPPPLELPLPASPGASASASEITPASSAPAVVAAASPAGATSE